MPVSPVHRTRQAALLASGAIALISACASIESSAMQRIFDSWKGAPVEQVKAQWGPPQSVQTVPGGTAYVWIDEIPTAHPPGYGPRDAGLEPPATVAHYPVVFRGIPAGMGRQHRAGREFSRFTR